MPRSRNWDTYRKGAYILGPVVLATTSLAIRACTKVRVVSEEHEHQVEEARLRAELEDDIQKRFELQELEARARERAAYQPAPPSGPKPGVVASEQHWPEAIAVDATHVYWLSVASGEVLKAPKEGGAPVVLASGQTLDTPRHALTIALDDEAVYWVTSGTREAHRTDGAVMRIPKSGGEPKVLASGQTKPLAIAVRGKDVFWIDGPGEPQAGAEAPPGFVMAVAKAGGKPRNLSTASLPCGLAADDSHVYWAETDARTLTINRTPRGGGDTKTVAVSTGRLGCSLALDATQVFWIDKSADMIMSAPKSGEGVAQIGILKARLSALVVDSSFVYALTEATPGELDESGIVWKLPKDANTPPVALAIDEPGVNQLAIDGKDVFWTRWSESNSDGSVLRRPK